MSLPAVTVAVPADPHFIHEHADNYESQVAPLLEHAALIHLLKQNVPMYDVMRALLNHHGDELETWLRDNPWIASRALAATTLSPA